MLAAEFKAGKTWAITDLAVSVASGTPWLGIFPVDAPGPVLLFAGEGGNARLRDGSRPSASHGAGPGQSPDPSLSPVPI